MTDQLQRRHFEAIAGIIKGLDMPENDKIALANAFENQLRKFNDNFDGQRFVTACLTGNMGKGRSHKNV